MKEILEGFALNQGTQIEYYNLDKNGIVIALVYQVVYDKFSIINKDGKVILFTDKASKLFNDIFDCLDYLKSFGIEFKEIIPTNLGKMFARV